MDKLADAIMMRQKEMEDERASFDSLRQQCADFVNPRRSDMAGHKPKGKIRQTGMYDGTAQDAFLSWVDGILGWYVSKSQAWCTGYVPDRRLWQNDQVIRYSQQYTEQMAYEFRASNFYDRLPEFLRDGAGVGTGCMLTEEARDLSKANLKVPHPGKVFIMEDDEGHTAVVHLKSTFTARQLVLKYRGAGDQLPDRVHEDAKKPDQSEHQYGIIQAIFRKDDPAIEDSRLGSKPWSSVHVLASDKQGMARLHQRETTDNVTIRVGGYSYNPATVWRFRKSSDEIYGRSPAMDVMCAIVSSQQIGRQLLHMGNRASDTPTMIPEELRATYSMLPGGKNFYSDPARLIQPIQFGGEYPIAKDREDAIHELIRKRYGYQFWHAMTILAQKSERVPATQVMELRADQAMMLVGQVDNLGSEGIAPIWDNVASVANKGGRLPDPPSILDEYQGKDIMRIKFIGPLAQFQESLFRLNGLKQALQTQAGLAQILGPQIFDAVKDVELTEYLWEAVNAPRQLLHTKEEVLQMRAERAEQEQAMQAAETAKTMAEGVNKLAKGAEPNSPLEQLVGAS